MTLTRRATLADLDAVSVLFDAYRVFYCQQSNLAIARDFIRERLAHDESVIFVVENDAGDLAGFTQLFPTFCSIVARRIWILNDLYVSPDLRKTGIGRALLDAAREFAVQNGAARLELSTAYNNPAQKLYEAAGYQRDNEFLYYALALDE